MKFKKIIAGIMSGICLISGSVFPVTVNAADYKLGDLNNDSKINAVDASETLSEYARTSTNKESEFTETQKQAADVNKDGKINAVDASNILSYYAYTSTSGTMDFEEYLINPPVTTTKTTTTYTTSTSTTITTTNTTTTVSITAFKSFIGANIAMEIPAQWKVSYPIEHEYTSKRIMSQFYFNQGEYTDFIYFNDVYFDNSMSDNELLEMYMGILKEREYITLIEKRHIGDIEYLYSEREDENNIFYDIAYNGCLVGFSVLKPNVIPNHKEVIEKIIQTLETDIGQIDIKNNNDFRSLSNIEKNGVIGLILFLNENFTYGNTAHIKKCSSLVNFVETGFEFELEYINVNEESVTETFVYSLEAKGGFNKSDMSDEEYNKLISGYTIKELNARKMDTVLQEYFSSWKNLCL